MIESNDLLTSGARTAPHLARGWRYDFRPGIDSFPSADADAIKDAVRDKIAPYVVYVTATTPLDARVRIEVGRTLMRPWRARVLWLDEPAKLLSSNIADELNKIAPAFARRVWTPWRDDLWRAGVPTVVVRLRAPIEPPLDRVGRAIARGILRYARSTSREVGTAAAEWAWTWPEELKP